MSQIHCTRWRFCVSLDVSNSWNILEAERLFFGLWCILTQRVAGSMSRCEPGWPRIVAFIIIIYLFIYHLFYGTLSGCRFNIGIALFLSRPYFFDFGIDMGWRQETLERVYLVLFRNVDNWCNLEATRLLNVKFELFHIFMLQQKIFVGWSDVLGRPIKKNNFGWITASKKYRTI